MVLSEIDNESRTGRIVLTPNASWSWQANLYLLYTLMCISIGIGIGFMLAGAWVILPYSILEMSVLGLCFYYVVRKCNQREVITVSEHEVLVQRGFHSPIESRNYHRMWAKFLVKPPKHPWDPEVVSIRSHGQELELGSFLSRGDKQRLIDALRRVVPS
jgi:uncharacterized membrane protein